MSNNPDMFGNVKKEVVDEEFIENMVEAEYDRDRYKKALETIMNSEECKVCKCQQVMGKTYDGLRFIHLQKIAMEAVKNG